MAGPGITPLPQVSCGGVPGTLPCRYYQNKSYRGDRSFKMCVKRTAEHKVYRRANRRRVVLTNFPYAYKRTVPEFSCGIGEPLTNAERMRDEVKEREYIAKENEGRERQRGRCA